MQLIMHPLHNHHCKHTLHNVKSKQLTNSPKQAITACHTMSMCRHIQYHLCSTYWLSAWQSTGSSSQMSWVWFSKMDAFQSHLCTTYKGLWWKGEGGGVVACLLDVAQWSGRIELNCILENTGYTIQASLVWFLVSAWWSFHFSLFPPQNIFVVIDFNSRGSLNCQPCSKASSFKVHVNKATTFSFYFLPLNSITISSWGKLF